MTLLALPGAVPFGAECFGGPLARGVEAPAPAPAGRDWDVLVAIEQILEDSGLFAVVEIAGGPEDLPLAADRSPAAWIYPRGDEDLDDADDTDGVSIVHRCEYEVALAVRDESPRSRVRQLDALHAAMLNLLDGVSLGGVTLPPLTKLRRGRYQAARHPEQRKVIAGEFSYLVEGFGGHDESERDESE